MEGCPNGGEPIRGRAEIGGVEIRAGGEIVDPGANLGPISDGKGRRYGSPKGIF